MSAIFLKTYFIYVRRRHTYAYRHTGGIPGEMVDK